MIQILRPIKKSGECAIYTNAKEIAGAHEGKALANVVNMAGYNR